MYLMQIDRYIKSYKFIRNQKMKGQQLLAKVKSIFPPLKSSSLKGQSGRVGVIGGSYEFTGAPYYSAVSSLKVGSDLAHIFCSKSSATAIKAYSPQLIVHPIFVSQEQIKCKQQEIPDMLEQWLQKIKKWQKAVHSWVIGPGLGRDKYMEKFFPKLVKNLPQQSVIIFDADGIYYLCQHPQLFDELHKYKAIITPNNKQLQMIQKALNISIKSIVDQIKPKNNHHDCQVEEFHHQLNFKNFSLLVKGQRDVVLGPKNFIISTEGGPKRCGGIGDILSGAMVTCAYWNFEYGPALASIITRMATKKAFHREGRGLTAPTVIEQLPYTVIQLQTKPPLL